MSVDPTLDRQNDEAARRVTQALRRVVQRLKLPFDATELDLGDVQSSTMLSEHHELLIASARQVGIFVKELDMTADDIESAMLEGYPVIVLGSDGVIWVLEQRSGRKIESTRIDEQTVSRPLSLSKVRELLSSGDKVRTLLAKRELECDSMSAKASGDGHHHSNSRPLRRFLALLSLDHADIWTVATFALVSGILALATPLAIESLVNVVSWGTYLQPLLILALMLGASLGLAGVLRVLQAVVVEMIQRRQFVRIVGDLSHRFPRADQRSLVGTFPRELANRLFDIMTIQKASAVLLLDGVGIMLTTVLGLLLLAFYHPFLLGFDIVLVISMITITWILGRGGVRTAIDESIVKYRAIHWLQDVISAPAAFKVNGGEFLAIERANSLTAEYLSARQLQFQVVIRQVAFATGLQVIASTTLLGLGGWLVIKQQLTLGQLVASELVVTVVIGAFAKAGKSLEKYYDLMAGIDKVAHLLDIPVDQRYELGDLPPGPATVRWEELGFEFHSTETSCHIVGSQIAAGERVAITGGERSGKSLLVRSLAGLMKPSSGIVEISGMDAPRAALGSNGRMVGFAGRGEFFHGTLADNVDLGRSWVGQNRVRDVLAQVGLWDSVLHFPTGLRTMLESNGSPLSSSQQAQLLIAQAMAGMPRLLLIDGLLDELTTEALEAVWPALLDKNAAWTLIVVTKRPEIAERLDRTIHLD